MEDYNNLTSKTLSVLEYAHSKSYRLVFKTDDDTFVRVDRLWDAIENVPSSERNNAFMGKCTLSVTHTPSYCIKSLTITCIQQVPSQQGPDTPELHGHLPS